MLTADISVRPMPDEVSCWLLLWLSVRKPSFGSRRSLTRAHARFQHRGFSPVGKRKRRLSCTGERSAKRARTDGSWTMSELARMIAVNQRLYPPTQFGEPEKTTLESALVDFGEEIARMDLVCPAVEWEGEAMASTTEPGADDCLATACHTAPPIQESGTSKVVLRRARRLYGRSYQKGEEVEVRRSRRLAMKPRVSYVGMC
jgi:hypothetical protein